MSGRKEEGGGKRMTLKAHTRDTFIPHSLTHTLAHTLSHTHSLTHTRTHLLTLHLILLHRS